MVVEVGGALRTYSVGGLDLLDGYAAGERCTGARGQSLIPWPNRLQDGSYRLDGADLQLPLTEPAKRNAIHGLVRFANWQVAERDDDQVTMAHLLHEQPGYPASLDLRLRYTLDDAGLTITVEATNVSTGPAPFGAGAHPYLRLGTDVIDPLVLRSPGTRVMRTDDRGIPVRTEPVDGTPEDFRDPRAIGGAVLDTGYAALERDGGGRATVELSTPDGARRVSLWMDEAFDYLMLFTGDSLPEADRHRRGLGVEPMTCAPNAFRTGEGLRILQPGETFRGSWGIEPQLDGR
jgi:aldose 1-epimerase